MKKKILILGGIVIVVAVLFFASHDRDRKEMKEMKSETPAVLTNEQAAELKAGETAHKPGILSFHVTGGSYYYSPNVIHVKKDDTVRIIFTNAGGKHNFLLDEFNVKMAPISTGESRTMEFKADKTGSFEYYCGIGNHRKMGQKGTLIVE